MAQVGLGGITWGTLTGIFDAESGLTDEGYNGTAIDIGIMGDAVIKRVGGDTPDPGTVAASIQVPSTTDLNALVNTTAAMVVTNPDGTTKTGNGILLSIPTSSERNGKTLAACVFQWDGAIVTAAGV